MKRIEVCLSVQQLPCHNLKDKCVIAIDIFRATTCLVTAINKQVNHLLVFDDVDKCRVQKENGYLLAGERQGIKIPDFDLGNSPLEYQKFPLKSKKIAITTTNGTKAIIGAKEKSAFQVLIGAFSNFSILCKYLTLQEKNIVLLCAGWRGRTNIEDTAYAGAVVNNLVNQGIEMEGDEARIATYIWSNVCEDKNIIINHATHGVRLDKRGLKEDLFFCLELDTCPIIPQYAENIVSLLPFS